MRRWPPGRTRLGQNRLTYSASENNVSATLPPIATAPTIPQKLLRNPQPVLARTSTRSTVATKNQKYAAPIHTN